MKKYYFKLIIFVLGLSLFFTGLIILKLFYFSNSLSQIQFTEDYSHNLKVIKKNNLFNDKQQEHFHFASPNKTEFFEMAFKFNKQEINFFTIDVIGGIIPHHLLAADLIAEFFYNLKDKDYDTVILIGPNHFSSGESDVIISTYDWQTPYGILEFDKDILEEILMFDKIKVENDALIGEHSINSEVSFVKKIFPQSRFLPIILKSNVDKETAKKLAERLFEISQNKKVLVLASVDFSHYKDSITAQNNDRISINTIENFYFDKIYDLDIDSPASIYTLLKFSQLGKSEFRLLNNSNSAILIDKPDLESTTSYVTGYFVR